jgi:YD repeat-containing protein
MNPTRRTVIGGALAAAAASTVTLPASATARLSHHAHLDFLRTSVTPPAAAGHTTFGSGPVGVLWTYADRQSDGSYKRIGGGTYDAATNTYGQGAFNADDIARAAVVYLRHWKLFHETASLDAARGLLRSLTFLQSPNGNVVLWMQPDGTLNPSADPVELPDPSDSGPSYWLARTVWALGEGYAAFRSVDRAFATFLRDRLELAIAALERQVLVRYGQYNVVDGRRLPAWLIVNGADATSEAVLGLAAYVQAGGPAHSALARFAEGIAKMGAGSTREWPFRALMPWGESISDWHAWGAQMPSALAAAASALGRRDLLLPAIGDTAGFTPLLLASGGPDNGWLPVPIDRSQIAYGVDARLQALLAVGGRGQRQLAAFVAAWYFGANHAGLPMYDATTGRTYDGISGDGAINRNSGAESTIHGQLSMLALDADPDITRLSGAPAYDGLQIVEAESATGGQVVTPPSAWTGESQWSNGSYLSLDGAATWTLTPAAQPRLVLPVVNLTDKSDRTVWSSGSRVLGTLDYRGGPQGISAAPGALQPLTLTNPLPANASTLEAVGTGQLDALLLIPLISSLRIGNATLLVSVDTTARTVSVPGKHAYAYDAAGKLVAQGNAARAVVQPGGFTVVLG